MFLTINPTDYPTLGHFVDDPTKHRDFAVREDAPLTDDHGRPLPVYVPSLVELVHRLGGLENIPHQVEGGTRVCAMLVGDVAKENNVRGQVVKRKLRNGVSLLISNWHPAPYLCDLSVLFHLPDRWTTCEWEVTFVLAEGENLDGPVANTDALRLDVVRLCNQLVGLLIADPLHAVRKSGGGPGKGSRFFRPSSGEMFEPRHPEQDLPATE